MISAIKQVQIQGEMKAWMGGGGGGGGCSYIKRMGVLIVTFRGFGKRVLPQKLELLQYLLIGVLSKKKLF